jgi:hypothetical protein
MSLMRLFPLLTISDVSRGQAVHPLQHNKLGYVAKQILLGGSAEATDCLIRQPRPPRDGSHAMRFFEKGVVLDQTPAKLGEECRSIVGREDLKSGTLRSCW